MIPFLTTFDIFGTMYPRKDSLGFYYMNKINNSDGTITTNGWIPGRNMIIQKVWSSSSDFKVIAIFKPKKNIL